MSTGVESLEAVADVIWMRANAENRVRTQDRETDSYAVAEEVAREVITAYLATLTTEWAGDHKHADIELGDEDGEPFVSEEDAIDNYADYPNTTVVHRRVTPWTPVDVNR